MAKPPEIVFDLVPQEFEVTGRGLWDDHFKVRVPDEFTPPKNLVFREKASFLTPAEQDIMQGVIEGDTNRQIALKRKRSHETVANHITNIGKRLREEGFVIPKSTSDKVRINIILALLQTGELELRNPVK